MLRVLGLLCLFIFNLFGCNGSPIVDPGVNQPENDFQEKEALGAESPMIQKLYSLLNESVLQVTLSEFSLPANLQKEQDQTVSPNILNVQLSTERLYTSKPYFEAIEEDNINQAKSEILQKSRPSRLANESNSLEQDETTLPDILIARSSTERLFTSEPIFEINEEDNFNLKESQNRTQQFYLLPAVKETLEQQTQSGLNDLTLENSPNFTGNLFKEPINQVLNKKSPLEYQFQRPSYASAPGGISGGYLGQLIPPGKPWPADPPKQTISLQDRFKVTTTKIVQELLTQKSTTKSPLEYQTQRPSYASAPGGISGGHLGQLIPPGIPWPAHPPQENITLHDRFKETTTTSVQGLSTQKATTKSPLEYQSHRPSYASAPGGISGGHLGQLIPSGDPLPADATKQNITLEDRLKETTTARIQELPTKKATTKSPLDYQSHRPSYASAPGGISGGHLGQLIPPGDPLPADTLQQNVTLQDRLKETTTAPIQELPTKKATTKSPLESQSHRPSYASAPGGISGGHLGQLIPSGDPLPADTLQQNVTLQDRLKETTTAPIQELPTKKATTKSPLEYQSHRPSYASAPGGISGGHLGQLIPSGDPLPADTLQQNVTLQDRLKETTIAPIQELPPQKATTKSPLEYQSHRPSYASAPGGISGGHLGQLIPSGDPLPADTPQQNVSLEDRFKETTSTMIVLGISTKKPTTKSPLEYQSQRPSYASAPGGISGGDLGHLIPSGEPWPADVSKQNVTLQDRFKETTAASTQELPTQKSTTKSPLEYQSQRPSYVSAPGGISGGHWGQLIPSGDPWPANPPQQNVTLQDSFKETTVQELASQKTKSRLEYQSQ